jgi:hypothetical protein
MTATDELWALLPEVYRRRDAEDQQGGALRALIELLGAQADVLAEDLARLYDNWFVETCDPWVVAYIGELVGVRPLHPVGGRAALPRAYVANTLAYRRRKGTPAVLEQLARDVTGWPAQVVESFQLLETTQHLSHVRPANLRTPDLRDAGLLERLGGPFERAAHTLDARRPPAGRYGIHGIGLHLWRLRPFHLGPVTARPLTDPPDGRYHFDPLGLDTVLFNDPEPEESITSLATERHVPGPLGRRELFDRGPSTAVRVWADTGAGLQEVPAGQLVAADLADPPPAVTTGWRRPPAPLVAAVDPVLGRLAFRDGTVPDEVEVEYTYGFGGEVGAGPYERDSELTDELIGAVGFVRVVGRDLPARADDLISPSVAAALGDWDLQPAGTVGVIAVLDSRSYDEDLAVTVPAGSSLLLAGGAWPEVEAGASGGRLQLDDRRPHLRRSIGVTGSAGGGGDGAPRGRLVIDGLLVEGGVRVHDGDLGELRLLHATVAPGGGAVRVDGGNADLQVVLDRCVTGPLGIAAEGPALRITSSIVDGDLQAHETEVQLDAVTVLGELDCRALEASDCLLTGTVTVERAQQGCVRFSFLGDAARTPRRYRCQVGLPAPQLTSTRFGDPGYGQLADRCAEALRQGSSQQSDMGAFGDLLRPQREANLRAALDEYLRFGLEAGIFHAT